MAVNIETVANKIFKVIKGSGHDVKMYDASTGNETVDPTTSRYFYVKMPNYMVHLDPDNSEIKLHQGAEKIDKNIQGVINNIKHIAKSYMLDFDHRIFGKELTPKNYAFKIDQNRNERDMSELQTEGYTPLQGSTKTSEQKLEGVKVIVRHNKAVDETSRGARSRNIQGIFVETSEGERFKYPHIHLNGARAMARHVHAGGKPHDEVGEAIVNLSDQLAKLKEVTKFARRFSQVQEQAADVLPLVDNKVADIKKTIHKLTTASGYADFKENYKATETAEPTIEALEELKGKFTVTKFDEKIGEVLPLLQSIVDEAKAEQDNSSKAIADRIMAKIKAGDPVDMHEPNATQQEYDPEKVGSFTNKDAKVAYRLSDLAAKIKDDEMSVFLARLSDKFTGYATDPNIKMKIKQDPETYEIQPWEKETAKAIIQGVKMKTVKPELDKLPKAEDVVPNPEAELEEAVAPFGEDVSFMEAMPVKKDDPVKTATKNVMSFIGNDVNRQLSYDKWLKQVKGIERGARGISADQHIKFSKEWKSYKGENAITQADLDAERFAELHDFEEYKDAVMSDIKDPNSMYAGKSNEEIIAMLRKEADGIGYADISDGDRRPEEPTWLNKIADEMENARNEASDYEGQDEAHAHQISLDGDWDEDRGISDSDCSEVELALEKVGIKSQCEPDEMRQGGIVVHTMADRDTTIDALSKAGFNINETAKENPEIQRIKDLAGL